MFGASRADEEWRALEMTEEERLFLERAVRLDAPEEPEASVERRVRAAWEFPEREEVLSEREARRVLARLTEARALWFVARCRQEQRWPGGFRVRGHGIRACGDL